MTVGFKPRPAKILEFEVVMTNRVTFEDISYIVCTDSIDNVEAAWFEVHENETEVFEQHDAFSNWDFVSAQPFRA